MRILFSLLIFIHLLFLSLNSHFSIQFLSLHFISLVSHFVFEICQFWRQIRLAIIFNFDMNIFIWLDALIFNKLSFLEHIFHFTKKWIASKKIIFTFFEFNKKIAVDLQSAYDTIHIHSSTLFSQWFYHNLIFQHFWNIPFSIILDKSMCWHHDWRVVLLWASIQSNQIIKHSIYFRYLYSVQLYIHVLIILSLKWKKHIIK